MKRKLGTLFCSVLVLGGIWTGCTPPSGNQPTRNGSVSVLITDKPFPFDMIKEALVTITRVEVRRADSGDNDCGESCDDGLFCNGVEYCDDGQCVVGQSPCGSGTECHEDMRQCTAVEAADDVDSVEDVSSDESAEQAVNESDDDDSDDEFIVIFEGEQTFNLLDLQNGRTDLLAGADIPAGRYTQMRLIVTEGRITLNEDDREFSLRVPSGQQTGIKLHFTFEVAADAETQLLLDVDLSRAFSPIPGGKINNVSEIRNFRFSPSVAMKLIDMRDAGQISGTASTTVDGYSFPLQGVAVTAYKDDVEVTSTSTEVDGNYMLGGLTTGEYRVEFSANDFEDLSVTGVSVTAGETTANVNASMQPSPEASE